jgi:hypothetical protein
MTVQTEAAEATPINNAHCWFFQIDTLIFFKNNIDFV